VLRRHGTLWVALALVAVWVGVCALLNSGQWGDHFEQFVWAHSLEWGYHKHPPLPTWLLAGLIGALGPSPYWTYLLAALCTAGTGLCTYHIASRLLGPPLAGLALLLWGLQQAFSVRAQLYNHNTVLMLAVGATAWCVLAAVDTGRWRWWLAAGAAAGAAMLSKYQAVVPLAGLVVALMLTGELRRATVLRGLALAAAVAALMFLPHVLWMLQHDFSTVRYAAREGPLAWPARGHSIVSFLAQQLRLLFPALLFALLLRLWPGLRQRDDLGRLTAGAESLRWRRAWFVGLVVFPLVITVLTCPTFGLKLQNHWGYQCLQFVGLWLAWRMRGLAQRGAKALVALALLVQVGFMALAAQASWTGVREAGRRADTRYPAAALAAAVQRDWQVYTSCPLAFVVGPPFEAGMVSVYSAQPPVVLEWGDFSKSPWVRPQELVRLGAVFVDTDLLRLPKGVLLDSMAVKDAGGDRVYWTVVPPTSCGR
jgi:4-amino-4-deoxy-L-arabinose transferase-like glycosyltransferase